MKYYQQSWFRFCKSRSTFLYLNYLNGILNYCIIKKSWSHCHERHATKRSFEKQAQVSSTRQEERAYFSVEQGARALLLIFIIGNRGKTLDGNKKKSLKLCIHRVYYRGTYYIGYIFLKKGWFLLLRTNLLWFVWFKILKWPKSAFCDAIFVPNCLLIWSKSFLSSSNVLVGFRHYLS